MQSNYLFYALIAAGIFTAYMALVNLFRRDRARARLASALPEGFDADDGGDSGLPTLAVWCERFLTVLGIDTRTQPKLALLLAQAGVTSPYGVAYYLFFERLVQPLLLLLSLGLGAAVTFATGVPFLTKLLLGFVAFLTLIAGLFGAKLYVTNRKQHRQQILLAGFPEALDLLLVCIESGLAMDASINRVCSEMKRSHPEIAQELERTRLELTLLPDRTQALQHLAERTEIVPFRALVSALIQTEKFGTSLLDTLRVLSEDQRTTRLYNAENRAARIPVLITIPLILCILPAFIMIILGPPLVRVIEQGGIFGDKTPGN